LWLAAVDSVAIGYVAVNALALGNAPAVDITTGVGATRIRRARV